MVNSTYTDYFVRGLLFLDLLAMITAFSLSAVLWMPSVSAESISAFMSVRLSVGNLFAFIGLLFIWATLSMSFGLVSQKALLNPSSKNADVILFVSIGALIVLVVALLLSIEFMTSIFLTIFWVSAAVLTMAGRYFLSFVYSNGLGRESRRPRLLIVGINSRSIQFAEDIDSEAVKSHRVVGFVDDKDYRTEQFLQSDYEWVTDIDNLQDYLRTSPIDEVLISLPMKSRYDDASKLVSICEEQGIKLRILADLFQYRMTHSKPEQFGRTSVITVASHGMTGVPGLIKRLMDIFASSVALLLLSPIFLLVAIVVKLTSPGEVFFSQERIGLNKMPFPMIKFRTMVVDAEERQAAIEDLNEASGPAFKIKNDPRITGVGKVLRRTSVDELPQLLNVLRGEMSLVGPRPLPLRDYSGFSEDWHRRRVSVRPGMTGLWQVESRDHSSFDKWMKLDMQYIDRWSLWLDIRIIFKTIPAMIRGAGD